MNKKGFTLIELVTTFALASVIIIILVNIIGIIKEIYVKTDVKSKLLVEQSNLSHLINTKFEEDSLESYTACMDTSFCYKFNFIDGTSAKLIVGEDYITFDNYTYKLVNDSTIESTNFEIIEVDTIDENSNNAFLIIEIEIKNKLYKDKDFGINLVYQYNSREIAL